MVQNRHNKMVTGAFRRLLLAAAVMLSPLSISATASAAPAAVARPVTAATVLAASPVAQLPAAAPPVVLGTLVAPTAPAPAPVPKQPARIPAPTARPAASQPAVVGAATAGDALASQLQNPWPVLAAAPACAVPDPNDYFGLTGSFERVTFVRASGVQISFIKDAVMAGSPNAGTWGPKPGAAVVPGQLLNVGGYAIGRWSAIHWSFIQIDASCSFGWLQTKTLTASCSAPGWSGQLRTVPGGPDAGAVAQPCSATTPSGALAAPVGQILWGLYFSGGNVYPFEVGRNGTTGDPYLEPIHEFH